MTRSNDSNHTVERSPGQQDQLRLEAYRQFFQFVKEKTQDEARYPDYTLPTTGDQLFNEFNLEGELDAYVPKLKELRKAGGKTLYPESIENHLACLATFLQSDGQGLGVWLQQLLAKVDGFVSTLVADGLCADGLAAFFKVNKNNLGADKEPILIAFLQKVGEQIQKSLPEDVAAFSGAVSMVFNKIPKALADSSLLEVTAKLTDWESNFRYYTGVLGEGSSSLGPYGLVLFSLAMPGPQQKSVRTVLCAQNILQGHPLPKNFREAFESFSQNCFIDENKILLSYFACLVDPHNRQKYRKILLEMKIGSLQTCMPETSRVVFLVKHEGAILDYLIKDKKLPVDRNEPIESQMPRLLAHISQKRQQSFSVATALRMLVHIQRGFEGRSDGAVETACRLVAFVKNEHPPEGRLEKRICERECAAIYTPRPFALGEVETRKYEEKALVASVQLASPSTYFLQNSNRSDSAVQYVARVDQAAYNYLYRRLKTFTKIYNPRKPLLEQIPALVNAIEKAYPQRMLRLGRGDVRKNLYAALEMLSLTRNVNIDRSHEEGCAAICKPLGQLQEGVQTRAKRSCRNKLYRMACFAGELEKIGVPTDENVAADKAVVNLDERKAMLACQAEILSAMGGRDEDSLVVSTMAKIVARVKKPSEVAQSGESDELPGEMDFSKLNLNRADVLSNLVGSIANSECDIRKIANLALLLQKRDVLYTVIKKHVDRLLSQEGVQHKVLSNLVDFMRLLGYSKLEISTVFSNSGNRFDKITGKANSCLAELQLRALVSRGSLRVPEVKAIAAAALDPRVTWEDKQAALRLIRDILPSNRGIDLGRNPYEKIIQDLPRGLTLAFADTLCAKLQALMVGSPGLGRSVVLPAMQQPASPVARDELPSAVQYVARVDQAAYNYLYRHLDAFDSVYKPDKPLLGQIPVLVEAIEEQYPQRSRRFDVRKDLYTALRVLSLTHNIDLSSEDDCAAIYKPLTELREDIRQHGVDGEDGFNAALGKIDIPDYVSTAGVEAGVREAIDNCQAEIWRCIRHTKAPKQTALDVKRLGESDAAHDEAVFKVFADYLEHATVEADPAAKGNTQYGMGRVFKNLQSVPVGGRGSDVIDACYEHNYGGSMRQFINQEVPVMPVALQQHVAKLKDYLSNDGLKKGYSKWVGEALSQGLGFVDKLLADSTVFEACRDWALRTDGNIADGEMKSCLRYELLGAYKEFIGDFLLNHPKEFFGEGLHAVKTQCYAIYSNVFVGVLRVPGNKLTDYINQLENYGEEVKERFEGLSFNRKDDLSLLLNTVMDTDGWSERDTACLARHLEKSDDLVSVIKEAAGLYGFDGVNPGLPRLVDLMYVLGYPKREIEAAFKKASDVISTEPSDIIADKIKYFPTLKSKQQDVSKDVAPVAVEGAAEAVLVSPAMSDVVQAGVAEEKLGQSSPLININFAEVGGTAAMKAGGMLQPQLGSVNSEIDDGRVIRNKAQESGDKPDEVAQAESIDEAGNRLLSKPSKSVRAMRNILMACFEGEYGGSLLDPVNPETKDYSKFLTYDNMEEAVASLQADEERKLRVANLMMVMLFLVHKHEVESVDSSMQPLVEGAEEVWRQAGDEDRQATLELLRKYLKSDGLRARKAGVSMYDVVKVKAFWDRVISPGVLVQPEPEERQTTMKRLNKYVTMKVKAFWNRVISPGKLVQSESEKRQATIERFNQYITNSGRVALGSDVFHETHKQAKKRWLNEIVVPDVSQQYRTAFDKISGVLNESLFDASCPVKSYAALSASLQCKKSIIAFVKLQVIKNIFNNRKDGLSTNAIGLSQRLIRRYKTEVLDGNVNDLPPISKAFFRTSLANDIVTPLSQIALIAKKAGYKGNTVKTLLVFDENHACVGQQVVASECVKWPTVAPLVFQSEDVQKRYIPNVQNKILAGVDKASELKHKSLDAYGYTDSQIKALAAQKVSVSGGVVKPLSLPLSESCQQFTNLVKAVVDAADDMGQRKQAMVALLKYASTDRMQSMFAYLKVEPLEWFLNKVEFFEGQPEKFPVDFGDKLRELSSWCKQWVAKQEWLRPAMLPHVQVSAVAEQRDVSIGQQDESSSSAPDGGASEFKSEAQQCLGDAPEAPVVFVLQNGAATAEGVLRLTEGDGGGGLNALALHVSHLAEAGELSLAVLEQLAGKLKLVQEDWVTDNAPELLGDIIDSLASIEASENAVDAWRAIENTSVKQYIFAAAVGGGQQETGALAISVVAELAKEFGCGVILVSEKALQDSKGNETYAAGSLMCAFPVKDDDPRPPLVLAHSGAGGTAHYNYVEMAVDNDNDNASAPNFYKACFSPSEDAVAPVAVEGAAEAEAEPEAVSVSPATNDVVQEDAAEPEAVPVSPATSDAVQAGAAEEKDRALWRKQPHRVRFSMRVNEAHASGALKKVEGDGGCGLNALALHVSHLAETGKLSSAFLEERLAKKLRKVETGWVTGNASNLSADITAALRSIKVSGSAVDAWRAIENTSVKQYIFAAAVRAGRQETGALDISAIVEPANEFGCGVITVREEALKDSKGNETYAAGSLMDATPPKAGDSRPPLVLAHSGRDDRAHYNYVEIAVDNVSASNFYKACFDRKEKQPGTVYISDADIAKHAGGGTGIIRDDDVALTSEKQSQAAADSAGSGCGSSAQVQREESADEPVAIKVM